MKRFSIFIFRVIVLGNIFVFSGTAAAAQPKIAPPAGAVRDLRVDGDTIWAAGDGGLILKSSDCGKTWQRLDSGGDANFQAVCLDGPTATFVGGRAVAGFPDGIGRGELLRTSDGGRSFRRIPAGPTGWLYGGVVLGSSALLAGQACGLAAGGAYNTEDDGRRWQPLALHSRGYLLGAAFDKFRYGYLVGGRQRIISLRNIAESKMHPSTVRSAWTLRAVTLTGPEKAWCVGDNGVALQGPAGRKQKPWPQKSLPIPIGLRRLCDFEAVDFHPGGAGYIAGGTIGIGFATRDGGKTFSRKTAPGPGAVHVIRHLDESKILAGGDAGRIWHSSDGGKTWALRHGGKSTDVMFIVAAGDISIYPAVVAHSRAGLSVAVIYATAPRRDDGIPPGQQLRATAVRAGATAATVLSDFASIVLQPTAKNLSASEKDILKAWSAALDVPAEREMLRQLTAAIRLYRPAVIAVGPEEPTDATGVAAENHLVSRLARKAAQLAADKDAYPELLAGNLPPHKTSRVFVGAAFNAHWNPPWFQPVRVEHNPNILLRRRSPTIFFDGMRFPRGAASCIDMLAADAVWRLGVAGLMDRPASRTAYFCNNISRPVSLMTDRMKTYAEVHLPCETPSTSQRMLAAGANLRIADARSRIATALPAIIQAGGEKPPAGSKIDPSLLAADRLLLAWWRLSEQGKPTLANQARDAFLKIGRRHPLYEMVSTAALATTCSREYHMDLLRRGASQPLSTAVVTRAVKKFPRLHPWSDTPAGRMLLAKALAAVGNSPGSQGVLAGIIRGPYPHVWRRYAETELHGPGRQKQPAARVVAIASFVAKPGRIDGLLNEKYWSRAATHAMLDDNGAVAGGDLAATLHIVRTATDVVLGLQLPAKAARTWKVTIAIDSDRNAWTQMLLEFDTTGHKSARLACRLGPAVKLPKKTFSLQSPRDLQDGRQSIELAIPIRLLDNPNAAGLWNFQLRATAIEGRGERNVYFQFQPDMRLLPERYGLLQFTAPVGAPSASPPG